MEFKFLCISVYCEVAHEGLNQNTSSYPAVFTSYSLLFSNSVAGGMLFERIVERNNLTEADCALYMKQVLQGVHHLHLQHIVHLELRVRSNNLPYIQG